MSGGNLIWTVPTNNGKPRLGWHFPGYQAVAQYGNKDTAVVQIQLYDCASLKTGVYSTEEWARLDWDHGKYCFDSQRVWSEGGAHSVDTDTASKLNLTIGVLGFSQQWTKPITPTPVGAGWMWELRARNTPTPPRLQFCAGSPMGVVKAVLQAAPKAVLIKLAKIVGVQVAKDMPKGRLLDDLLDGVDQMQPKPCWETNRVHASHNVEPDGDFFYVHNYGKSKGGYKHTFKLKYDSGGTAPKRYDDGKKIEWRGDDRRKISISWRCDAYEPCKPQVRGKQDQQGLRSCRMAVSQA